MSIKETPPAPSRHAAPLLPSSLCSWFVPGSLSSLPLPLPGCRTQWPCPPLSRWLFWSKPQATRLPTPIPRSCADVLAGVPALSPCWLSGCLPAQLVAGVLSPPTFLSRSVFALAAPAGFVFVPWPRCLTAAYVLALHWWCPASWTFGCALLLLSLRNVRCLCASATAWEVFAPGTFPWRWRLNSSLDLVGVLALGGPILLSGHCLGFSFSLHSALEVVLRVPCLYHGNDQLLFSDPGPLGGPCWPRMRARLPWLSMRAYRLLKFYFPVCGNAFDGQHVLVGFLTGFPTVFQ